MKRFGFLTRLFQKDDSGDSMYVAREKVYPREIKGRFQSLRKLAVFALLGLYYILPWINWDGRQAVLFDLPERKFHIFGLVFWPQDFFFLALLLILAALLLFFVTALAGRLWCGYACPQTVWTEVFIWMEELAEGNRNKRIKLDKGPWTREKFLRKLAKHSMWIVFALWTGFTFVGYFTPVDELAAKIVNFDTGPWETFWILFYSFATWGNAGFLREQVCIYMCPYARFQSAMFDKDTLIIAYDEDRGEPRGGRKRGIDPQEVGLGDCIDCNMCVQVCPTGIDIREGLQYECIACAACIDACDSVMDKMEYPRGLIRYSTQHAMDHKTTHVLRTRTIVYAVLLSLLAAAWVTGIALRKPADLDILRDRNALYRVVDDTVENVYTLKVMNKDTKPHNYTFEVRGIDGARVETDTDTVHVPGGEVMPVAVRIQVERNSLRGGGHDIEFVMISDQGTTIIEPSRFFMPVE